MDGIRQQFAEAERLWDAGDAVAAATLYDQILRTDAQHLGALTRLGSWMIQRGEPARGFELLSRAANLAPDSAEIHNNLGVACKALGRWEAAVQAFQRALTLDADYAAAHFNLADLAQSLGQLDAAATFFQRSWELDPADDDAADRLVQILTHQARWSDLEQILRRRWQQPSNHLPGPANTTHAESTAGSTAGSPVGSPAGTIAAAAAGAETVPLPSRSADQLSRLRQGFAQLATACLHQQKFAEAADIYASLLELLPDSAEVSSNLAYVLERLGRLDEAARAGERAVAFKPDSPECWNNLGSVYREQHRWDAARDGFARAVALRPDFALAQFNLGTQHLLEGEYLLGWPGYEWRHQLLDLPPRQLPMPRWRGQPLPGQTLFVHCEQGLGDTLQWVRFLPELQRRSQAEIVFECPAELLPLVANGTGVTLCPPCDTSFPPCPAHIPLPSVLGLLEVRLADLPGTPFPYLHVDPERRQLWRAGLHTLTDVVSLRSHIDQGLQHQRLVRAETPLRRVGLCWQGSRQNARDHVRSCPLSQLQPLRQVEGVLWYSLQRDPQAEQELADGVAGFTIISLEDEIHDLADRAALISELDLVISVDTSIAHLAGALGVPTWVLLCHTPDWRWLIDRNDSPWYPSLRLFRQPQWGDWPSVIDQVVAALRTWLPGERPA